MTLVREFNTHRMFSRSASSSRAIPVATMLKEVTENPVVPIYWGKNEPGMQSYQELEPEVKEQALKVWNEARDSAVKYASQLSELGVHKQYANLLLDPFTWIRVVVTATEWDNFFTLRLHETAKPEIRALAQEMRKAMDASTPVERVSAADPDVVEREDVWHLPFITKEERQTLPVKTLLQVSTARCARTSYNKHDGTPSEVEADVKLFEKLVNSVPPHPSPAEHQAVFISQGNMYANFRGWASLRFSLQI